MMKILPRNFLTRYCLVKEKGEDIRYVELQAVDQLIKNVLHYTQSKNI